MIAIAFLVPIQNLATITDVLGDLDLPSSVAKMGVKFKKM